MEHHLGAGLAVGNVKLWIAAVITDGQADLDAANLVSNQPIARRIVASLASQEAFIVAIDDLPLRIDGPDGKSLGGCCIESLLRCESVTRLDLRHLANGWSCD